MPLSDIYAGRIKGFEGFSPRPYWDVRQWTSGFGTRAAGPGEVIDPAEAERRFQVELGGAQNRVRGMGAFMTPGQEAALTSLTFNAGPKWMTSGLGAAVSRGDWNEAKRRFLQYVNAGGQPSQGLASRRAAEATWIDDPAAFTAGKMGAGGAPIPPLAEFEAMAAPAPAPMGAPPTFNPFSAPPGAPGAPPNVLRNPGRGMLPGGMSELFSGIGSFLSRATTPTLDRNLQPTSGPVPDFPADATDTPVVGFPGSPVGPFATTTTPAGPDADAIMQGASAAAASRPPEPQQPGYFARLMRNPAFLAGLSILGTPPGGAWGPNAVATLNATQRAQREQSQFDRQQQRRSVMDRIWAEAFPNGQPNPEHPLLRGMNPQTAAMIYSLGPDTALPLLAQSRLKGGNFAIQDGYLVNKSTGQVAQLPGGGNLPTAVRTQSLKVDQAYKSLEQSLDGYARLVERTGANVLPGQEADAIQQARTNILLQLKELYNLGVLNGPDLELMEQMLPSPSIGLTGGIANMLPGNAAARVKAGVARLKELLRGVRNTQPGLPPVGRPEPSGNDPLGIR